jgi:hypothetical protein
MKASYTLRGAIAAGQDMVTFEDRFYSDGVLSCLLWADEPQMKQVRFNIGPAILQDVLHGGNPVHDNVNVALCETNRSRIEAACRQAFSKRPAASIDLQPMDFSQ